MAGTPAKRGARSIRGAMATYTWVSAVAVVLLGLVLWFGPDDAVHTTPVTLAADWEGALLEGDGLSFELRTGETREVPSGQYRLTLFPREGDVTRQTIELGDQPLRVGASGD